MMELLEAAVKARLNIIIAGGTGSGKTTLLNALSCFINAQGTHRHHRRRGRIAAEAAARGASGNPARRTWKATGAVRQRELLVNSLRMRPDRIVVGEVRGEEALDMLQAMNTGHDGSLTTVHANTPRDAVSRLEVMVSLANANMQLVSIRQQIASAVQPAGAGVAHERRLAPRDHHHRGDRHGRRSGHAAGLFRVRKARSGSRTGRCWAASPPPASGPKFYEKLLAAGIRLRPDLFDEVVEV